MNKNSIFILSFCVLSLLFVNAPLFAARADIYELIKHLGLKNADDLPVVKVKEMYRKSLLDKNFSEQIVDIEDETMWLRIMTLKGSSYDPLLTKSEGGNPIAFVLLLSEFKKLKQYFDGIAIFKSDKNYGHAAVLLNSSLWEQCGEISFADLYLREKISNIYSLSYYQKKGYSEVVLIKNNKYAFIKLRDDGIYNLSYSNGETKKLSLKDIKKENISGFPIKEVYYYAIIPGFLLKKHTQEIDLQEFEYALRNHLNISSIFINPHVKDLAKCLKDAQLKKCEFNKEWSFPNSKVYFNYGYEIKEFKVYSVLGGKIFVENSISSIEVSDEYAETKRNYVETDDNDIYESSSSLGNISSEPKIENNDNVSKNLINKIFIIIIAVIIIVGLIIIFIVNLKTKRVCEKCGTQLSLFGNYGTGNNKLCYSCSDSNEDKKKPSKKNILPKEDTLLNNFLQELVSIHDEPDVVDINNNSDVLEANQMVGDINSRKEGIEKLKVLSKRFPDSGNIAALYVQALSWDERSDDAIQFATKSLPRVSTKSDLTSIVGIICLSNGDLQEAALWFLRSAAAQPPENREPNLLIELDIIYESVGTVLKSNELIKISKKLDRLIDGAVQIPPEGVSKRIQMLAECDITIAPILLAAAKQLGWS